MYRPGKSPRSNLVFNSAETLAAWLYGDVLVAASLFSNDHPLVVATNISSISWVPQGDVLAVLQGQRIHFLRFSPHPNGWLSAAAVLSLSEPHVNSIFSVLTTSNPSDSYLFAISDPAKEFSILATSIRSLDLSISSHERARTRSASLPSHTGCSPLLDVRVLKSEERAHVLASHVSPTTVSVSAPQGERIALATSLHVGGFLFEWEITPSRLSVLRRFDMESLGLSPPAAMQPLTASIVLLLGPSENCLFDLDISTFALFEASPTCCRLAHDSSLLFVTNGNVRRSRWTPPLLSSTSLLDGLNAVALTPSLRPITAKVASLFAESLLELSRPEGVEDDFVFCFADDHPNTLPLALTIHGPDYCAAAVRRVVPVTFEGVHRAIVDLLSSAGHIFSPTPAADLEIADEVVEPVLAIPLPSAWSQFKVSVNISGTRPCRGLTLRFESTPLMRPQNVSAFFLLFCRAQVSALCARRVPHQRQDPVLCNSCRGPLADAGADPFARVPLRRRAVAGLFSSAVGKRHFRFGDHSATSVTSQRSYVEKLSRTVLVKTRDPLQVSILFIVGVVLPHLINADSWQNGRSRCTLSKCPQRGHGKSFSTVMANGGGKGHCIQKRMQFVGSPQILFFFMEGVTEIAQRWLALCF